MEFIKKAQEIETIIKINNFNELSPSVLKQLQERFGTVRVQLVVPNRAEKNLDIYTPRTYKRLYYKLQELTEGIDDRLDDPLKFLFIYRRLSKSVAYDYAASELSKSHKQDPRYKKSRNLIGPLLEGQAVCSGFAEALMVGCNFKNVPCLYIDGISNNGGHSWNQVYLQNKWIGVDATWDIGGRMKYCSQDPKKFNNDHDYDSLMAFAKGDNHLLYQKFNWSQYLNSYLGLNTDCEYDEEELEYFYDLLEDVETRGADITQLMHDIKKRIRIHDGIKSMFKSAGYDYERTMKLINATDMELYDWILENRYSVTQNNSKRIIEIFSRQKDAENKRIEQQEIDKVRLRDYKSLNVARWADKHGIDYDKILELRMNQDELYNIIRSKDTLHRIKGIKKIHIKLKMSKSSIRKAIAQSKVKRFGGKYKELYEAGYSDEEIIKSDKSQIKEKIFLASREYNSQNNIDTAVATSGTTYEKLRRIGLTDFLLNEMGRYHCKAETIKQLLSYKIDGKKDPERRDEIIRQLETYKQNKANSVRKNVRIDGREEER